MFVPKSKFDALKLQLDAIQAKYDAATALFGEDGKKEDFSLSAAIQSMSSEGDSTEVADLKSQIQSLNQTIAAMKKNPAESTQEPVSESTTSLSFGFSDMQTAKAAATELMSILPQ
jgi:hypothetical protein